MKWSEQQKQRNGEDPAEGEGGTWETQRLWVWDK